MAESYEYSRHTSDGAAQTGPGVLHAVVLSAAGANATLDIYDETSGSGDVMCTLTAAQNTLPVRFVRYTNLYLL